MRNQDREVFKRSLEQSDKWLHLAILLGYIAIDHGADKDYIFGLIKGADKAAIDGLLLERMKLEAMKSEEGERAKR